MTYEEFRDRLDDIVAENAGRYGDFGFGYDIEWKNSVMVDAKVTWPPVNLNCLEDALRFAQALEAAGFEAAKLVGTEITG